jgi:hypothetical protein
MKQLIEGKTGSEQHSSSWGKFIVMGVRLVADERQADRHHTYTAGAAEVDDGTVFTIWQATGNRRGTDQADFYILLADSAQEPTTIDNGYGRLTGRWQVLAHGDGPVRAPRLLGWTKNLTLTEPLARHLGAQINLRGKAQPDPLEV